MYVTSMQCITYKEVYSTWSLHIQSSL